MEKKGLRKKDILRMDGLLPPTRRLPVCDAVSSASDKKKDKKWSLGGILRRISSIKDYDSSSNDEEIVYCKRTPRKPTRFNRRVDGVILHSIENNSERDKRTRVESDARHATDSRRDSLQSRSSDGSLDGLGKKFRRHKLKARAEAKRDHLRAGSSSDEDRCSRSNSSLNRFHVAADGAQNGSGQRSNMCNRRTRAARTERYIKRLSRDEGNGSGDTLNDLYSKRCSTDYTDRVEDKVRATAYADANGLCRPPVHPPPRRSAAYSSGRSAQQRSSAESLREVAERASLPRPEVWGDVRRYSTGQYITDLNQNNTYRKISRHLSDDVYNADGQHRAGNFFTYPAKGACHYPESALDHAVDRRRLINPDNQPPVPPPRDPRYRSFGYSSYPTNRHQNVPNYFKQEDNKICAAGGTPRSEDWMRGFRSYGSNNEVAWRDVTERELGSFASSPTAEFRNSLERVNNKYNSSYHRANEMSAYKEIETTRRRNIRNDQLNRSDANYRVREARNKSANICEASKHHHHETISSHASASDWSSGRSPCEQRVSRIITPPSTRATTVEAGDKRERNNREATPTEEALRERRRSSRNLEEALSELEAIYNSLRLGDEDLLDRAERRSMEEFNQRQGKSELDDATAIAPPPDSPDRTKDDMAYRRMHPKERPTSLSDIAGQSTLSSISYLIASPVLSRRDSADDLARLSSAAYPSRRDQPDVTRDDVVFRSISHANNTLRVIDPQPPFGIPLGPVSAATESDYLHTTPTKSEQPRSLYIPQCEPDVVTDDLAYRALRKDAVATRSVEGKPDGAREQPPLQEAAGGMRKKRAVRSLSANLYGLINHDRIHLQREPSLDAIRDEIQDVTRNFAATSERPEHLRRVVSDGELSDNDAHRWKELQAVKGGAIDINGNHPAMGAYRKKQCAYVSPETTRQSPKKEREESGIAELSDAMLSSKAILNDSFWHEYLQPSDSNVSAANNGRSTETDFTAYSRLCQDLVNLIKGDDDDDDDAATSPIVSPNADDSGVIVTTADKSNDNVRLEVDEPPPARVRVRSSGSRSPWRANDERNVESEKTASSTNSNSTRSTSSSSTPAANNLDFYLRVADENVKLIAEAFENVADRLRDSRLSARKTSPSLSRGGGSENEDQSGGGGGGTRRSSTSYSLQGDLTSDDRSSSVETSRLEEIVRVASSSNGDSLTSNEGDQGNASLLEDAVSTADAELDLSRAVRDLQLAAASLYEHEREIGDLGVAERGRTDDAATPPFDSADDESEDGAIRRISLIADALRQEPQERERDQEETVVLPGGIEARGDGGDEARGRASRREGERTVCVLDRTRSRGAAVGDETRRAPRVVTNLSTVPVTTCTTLLLACLLALLLAIVLAPARSRPADR
ncbi:PREDICTED: uncharacterized protein LOC105451302 [Wasmannia auropunctata]|uniref:uncharacterized protein LOC105451302 n=1 Tax=Wasmannia auropunctata TaxID=64793 RepID=UPI0005EEEA85|nr:PREDICTED: uncharacterized protein LOC105451302 [Wasmannia auropunctata]